MASFSVVLKPSAEKDLRSLPKPLAQRLWAKIEALSREPLPRQSVKLAGAEHLYRVRVGDHRIIYGLDNTAKQVVIHYVRHRSDAYRQAR
jgi:mRNA interferase RelE/StbE